MTKLTAAELEAVAATLDPYEVGRVGYRYAEECFEVGTALACSYVWDGDEQTGPELPGTCAFATAADVIHYARYSHGYVYVIAGDLHSWGDLPGEIILRAPVVMARFSC